MPLINSGSSIAVGKNIATESKTKPRKQAIAIALSVQRRAKGKTTLAQAKKERRED